MNLERQDLVVELARRIGQLRAERENLSRKLKRWTDENFTGSVYLGARGLCGSTNNEDYVGSRIDDKVKAYIIEQLGVAIADINIELEKMEI